MSRTLTFSRPVLSILSPVLPIFQMPIAVAYITEDLPRTRMELQSVKSAGKEVMLYPQNLQDFHREGLPIVIVTNGKLFGPTVLIGGEELNHFKLKTMIQFMKGAKEMAESCQKDLLQDEDIQLIQQVEQLSDDVSEVFSRYLDSEPPLLPSSVTGLKKRALHFNPNLSPADFIPLAPGQEDFSAKITPRKRVRQYKCKAEGCGEIFPSNDAVKDHERNVHKSLPALVCSTCDEKKVISFKSKRAWRTHQKLYHKGDWNFPCTVQGCEAMFNIKGELTRHLLHVHDLGEQIPCPHCKKPLNGELAMHRHFKEAFCSALKDFACMKCDKRLISKKSMEGHIENIHDVLKDDVQCFMKETFICPNCKAEMASLATYKAHYKRHKTKPSGKT